jgi:hypothetical protein
MFMEDTPANFIPSPPRPFAIGHVSAAVNLVEAAAEAPLCAY